MPGVQEARSLAGQRSSGVPEASCSGLQEFGDQLFSRSGVSEASCSEGQEFLRGSGVSEANCAGGREFLRLAVLQGRSSGGD